MVNAKLSSRAEFWRQELCLGRCWFLRAALPFNKSVCVGSDAQLDGCGRCLLSTARMCRCVPGMNKCSVAVVKKVTGYFEVKTPLLYMWWWELKPMKPELLLQKTVVLQAMLPEAEHSIKELFTSHVGKPWTQQSTPDLVIRGAWTDLLEFLSKAVTLTLQTDSPSHFLAMGWDTRKMSSNQGLQFKTNV